MGSILAVVLGLGLLIFVHELGHYLAARWIGARVLVFSLGFGPRLVGFRRGPTDYRICLLPLGGYVQVAGQDPLDPVAPARDSLHAKTVGQRTLFFLGGVLMNVLFALVAFPLAFAAGVEFVAPVVGGVDAGSGAWEAGLRKGDRIVSIDGKQTYSFENLNVEVALRGSRPIRLVVERDGTQFPLELRSKYEPAAGLYTLGIDSAREDRAPRIVVTGGGPADRAGLQDDDVLLAVGGIPTTGPTAERAFAALVPNQPGELVVRIARDGIERDVAIDLVPLANPGPPRIGVVPLARTVLGIRPGNAVLDALGLQEDDRILAVGDRPWRGDVRDFLASDGPLLVRVLRGGGEVRLEAPATAEARASLPEYLALGPDAEGLQLAPVVGGAADTGGLVAGDRVVALEGSKVEEWESMRSRIEAGGGTPMRLTVRRPPARIDPAAARILDEDGFLTGSETIQLVVTPLAPKAFDVGFDAMSLVLREEVREDSIGGAIRAGLTCSLDMTKQLYVTTKRLLSGEVAASNLGGIITISRVSYQFAQWGPSRFFYFLALLSLNLAFVNILPIPVLDGGHLMFLGIEAIKGSPVSPRIFSYSQMLGLVFVLALVVFVTYNDIVRLL